MSEREKGKDNKDWQSFAKAEEASNASTAPDALAPNAAPAASDVPATRDVPVADDVPPARDVSPASNPAHPAENSGSEPEADPDDEAPRVLNAGTSQELEIITYADDLLQHAQRRRKERNSEEDKEERLEESRHRMSEANQSLIIVRDVVDQWQMENREPKNTPAAPPMPPRSDGTPSQAPPPLPPRDEETPTPTPPPLPPRDEETPTPTPPPLPPRDEETPTPTPPPVPPRDEDSPDQAPPPLDLQKQYTPPPVVAEEPAAQKSARPDSTIERQKKLEDILTVNWDQELDPAQESGVPRSASSAIMRAPKDVDASSTSADEPDSPPVAPQSPAPQTPNAQLGVVPKASIVLTLIGGAVFVTATVLMALRIDPFATWYYLFAWYPFLMGVNHFTAVRSPRHSVWNGRIGRILALAAWSIPAWLTFELWNLRLDNWYYVGVPDDPYLRRIGILASFATVLPGIFFLEEAQRVRGWLDRLSTPSFAVSRGIHRTLVAVGVTWGAVVLLMPGTFFPLVWGVPVLLIEPWLRRRDESSLLARLSAGKPGLIVRLLAAGAICGLFWEAANHFALGKWIYTVPGFADGKLFEMPLLGFLGFPPFALCCWTIARALVALGALPEWQVEEQDPIDDTSDTTPNTPPSVNRKAAVIGAAVIFSALTLSAMDRFTVDSVTPRPEAIPGIPDGVTDYAAKHDRHDVRGLLELIEEGRLEMPGASSDAEVALLSERCRLILLRSIGTDNARRLDQVGIRTIDELAAADPEDLLARLATAERGWRPHPRRVAIWIAAARAERNAA